MKRKISVVKIGGNIINDEQLLDSFLTNFSKIKNDKILIHGGGKIATQLSKRLGVETKMIEGRRVTSQDDLDNIVMVYAGLINKKIISKLQKMNCNAIGLTGADANSISAVKRSENPINYGWVGDVVSVNSDAINMFLKNGITPVFCAVSHDGMGQLLNTNADSIASEVAIKMSNDYETELIYCFEKKGVLLNVEDENSVIENINTSNYLKLKEEKIIENGMIPKLDNCFYALNNKVSKVIVGSIDSINKKCEMCTTLNL